MQIASASGGYAAGVAVADGDFCWQGNAGACRNKGRFSVSDKPGEGGVGAVGFGGLEVTGGQRERVLLLRYWACAVVLVSLSQPKFGSAHTFSPL